jgi:uncharacterized protein with von Willebrand factor type A (vWA) domain
MSTICRKCAKYFKGLAAIKLALNNVITSRKVAKHYLRDHMEKKLNREELELLKAYEAGEFDLI